MNKQEIFDKVVLGIKAQGRPAYSAIGGCEYRTDDGRRCHVGLLLPEKLERPWDDVNNLGSVRINDTVRQQLLADHGPAAFADDFLLSLQKAHDEMANERGAMQRWRKNWRDRMLNLAVVQGLDSSLVDETPWTEPSG